MNWIGNRTGDTGVVVTVRDQAALLEDLGRRFSDGSGFSVATLNLDHVVKLRRDADFRAAYSAHSHITADGNPICWLCHLAGQKDVTLVPGSEVIDPLGALAAQHGIKVGLFGSQEPSLQAAAQGLKRAHPQIDIAMIRAPGMGFDPEGTEADAAIAAIAQSGVRLVFIALGAPKQEKFAAYAQDVLPQVGFVSIGAGLDFISGQQTRAPSWVRAIAAEWLWRMLGNPRRLVGRYASCIAILPSLTWSAVRARIQR
ncbi:WecB/TagA/CpsF family glycosyltransferase [Octadecabacter sp. B2R22]|nr:WecB/TagA/CpsF family glycosyltransferase [Octadecabacter sp. B2R22]